MHKVKHHYAPRKGTLSKACSILIYILKPDVSRTEYLSISCHSLDGEQPELFNFLGNLPSI